MQSLVQSSLTLALIGSLLLPQSAPAQVRPTPPAGPTRSPLSPDSPVNQPPDANQYRPYNDGYVELDLWRLEAQKFYRSRGVLSPDKQVMAYTEVVFLPDNRQTLSRLYLVPLAASGIKSTNPNQSLQQRQTLLSVGEEKRHGFEFNTLTIIDWSASGNRLLFKKKSGVLHVGLRTADILVYDPTQGTLTLYPEIQRAIRHYWRENSTLADLDTVAWDLYPLGWEPGSDSAILVKAWAWDQKNKKFLGIWRFDVDSERAELVSLEDRRMPVAANGVVAIPPPPPAPEKTKKRKPKKRKPADPSLTQ
jgi:hypothetical protein